MSHLQPNQKFSFKIYFTTSSWSWKSISKEKTILIFLLYLSFDILNMDIQIFTLKMLRTL